MKFGKVFRQTTEMRMPQWRDHMMGYKALKQAIKQQLAQGTHGTHTFPILPRLIDALRGPLIRFRLVRLSDRAPPHR